MKKSDKIYPSRKDFEELNAALYDGKQFIWKSSLFCDMEEMLGADTVLNAVNTNTFPEYKGKKYHFVNAPGDGHSIIVFFAEDIPEYSREKSDADKMIANVKDYVTNISFMTDELHNIMKANGTDSSETEEVIGRIRRVNMTVWMKTLFYDLVRSYSDEEFCSPSPDSFFDVMPVARAFAKQLSSLLEGEGTSVTVNGCSDLTGKYLNYNHLRIVLSLAVRDAFCLDYKPDYIYIDVKKKGADKAVLSVSGGTMNRTPSDPEKVRRIKEAMKDLPSDKFVRSFCSRYNCSIENKNTEYERSVEITVPLFDGTVTEVEREIIMARDRFLHLPAKFSPEAVILSDVVGI